ncbi:hypothetical protein P9112_011357 [Eukaryota sp. TZLM1-RC]
MNELTQEPSQAFRVLIKDLKLSAHKGVSRCIIRFEFGGTFKRLDLRHEGKGIVTEGDRGHRLSTSIISSLSSGTSHNYSYIVARRFSVNPKAFVSENLTITLESRPLIRKWKRKTLAHAVIPVTDLINSLGSIKTPLKKGPVNYTDEYAKKEGAEKAIATINFSLLLEPIVSSDLTFKSNGLSLSPMPERAEVTAKVGFNHGNATSSGMLVGVIKEGVVSKLAGQITIDGTPPSVFSNGNLEVCLKMSGDEILGMSSMFTMLRSGVVTVCCIHPNTKKTFLVSFHLNISYPDPPLIPSSCPLPSFPEGQVIRSKILVIVPKRVTNPPLETHEDAANGVSDLSLICHIEGISTSSNIGDENLGFCLLPYMPVKDVVVLVTRGKRLISTGLLKKSDLLDLLDADNRPLSDIPGFKLASPHPPTLCGLSSLFCIGRRRNGDVESQGKSSSVVLEVGKMKVYVDLFLVSQQMSGQEFQNFKDAKFEPSSEQNIDRSITSINIEFPIKFNLSEPFNTLYLPNLVTSIPCDSLKYALDFCGSLRDDGNYVCNDVNILPHLAVLLGHCCSLTRSLLLSCLLTSLDFSSTIAIKGNHNDCFSINCVLFGGGIVLFDALQSKFSSIGDVSDDILDIVGEIFTRDDDLISFLSRVDFFITASQILLPQQSANAQLVQAILKGDHSEICQSFEFDPVNIPLKISPCPDLPLVETTELARKAQVEITGWFSVKNHQIFRCDPELERNIRKFLLISPCQEDDLSVLLSLIRTKLPTGVSLSGQVANVKSCYPRIIRDGVVSALSNFIEGHSRDCKTGCVVGIDSVGSCIVARVFLFCVVQYSIDE